ncbi:MAG: LPS assembly lipoprotein LptE [Phycisphaerales bacterium]
MTGAARKAGIAGALAAALGVMWGCSSDPTRGYAFTSAHDSGITTVYVPTFRNTTFSHGLEVDLTDAIIKEIKSTTPWRVVSQGDAEASLSGTIVESSLRPLSYARTSGLVQEMGVTLTIEFDFKDTRTGRVIASRRNFSATESFVPARGVGERLEVGEHAGVQELARAVVAELRSGW